MRIIITDAGGLIFDGTIDQFEDCFFSGADEDSIRDFTEEMSWRVEFLEVASE